MTEFKEQAVKHVKTGKSIGAVAKGLGLIDQTLRNWVKAAAAGKLTGAGSKVVTQGQMELSRLRAENVRLKRECEILKKQRRTSRETHCEVRLDGQAAGIYARRDVRVLDVGVSGYQCLNRTARNQKCG